MQNQYLQIHALDATENPQDARIIKLIVRNAFYFSTEKLWVNIVKKKHSLLKNINDDGIPPSLTRVTPA